MKNLMTICLVVVVLCLCGSAGAATYYVATTGNDAGDGSAGNPWLTISHALTQVVYGDTINVAAGTYYEHIILENGVAVIGVGESSTTIDGGGSLSVVSSYSCGPDTILKGFTITNGNVLHGGGMYNSHSSPNVTNCTFSGNSATFGAGMYNYDSSPTVTDCTFSDNTTDSHGGGMRNHSSSNPMVTNCVFIGNTAYDGGGMGNNNMSEPIIINCTFSGNSADNFGGGMHNSNNSTSTIQNCIIWGNTAGSSYDEIYRDSSSAPWIHCSDIAGCGGSGSGWNSILGIDGGGNIDIDPLFVSVPSDLHLLAGSPCIDAGDDGALPTGVTTDLDGNPRIVFAFVDMGAYEFQNTAPVADAGNYQAVYEGDTVYLDGSRSYDDDDDELTYSWSFVSKPAGSVTVLSGADTVNPSFVADEAGMYVVSLVVNDGFVDSDADKTEIVAVTLQEGVTELLMEAEDVITGLDSGDLKNEKIRNPLLHWLLVILEQVDDGLYVEALSKLEGNVLPKTDGCAETGYVENNDWITDCVEQEAVYSLIDEAIGLLEELVGP